MIYETASYPIILRIQLRPREGLCFVHNHTASASRLQSQPWWASRTIHVCVCHTQSWNWLNKLDLRMIFPVKEEPSECTLNDFLSF